MAKKKIATVWLGGCSGCHMSLLDIDERILDVAASISDSDSLSKEEKKELLDIINDLLNDTSMGYYFLEVQKYLAETYKKVSFGRNPTNISQYGGSIFVSFSKTETYRFNIGLYKSEVTLD